MTRLHNHGRRCRKSALLLSLALLTAVGAVPAQAALWRFVAVGDTRGNSSGAPINAEILAELAQEIVAQGAEFVLVPGDLVYSGSLASFQSWTNIMAPVYQAGIGVYPVLGNHDANAVSAFIQVFGADLPDNGPAGELNRTYAFSCQNVLILGLDTYVNVGRVNQAWIDGILASNSFPHVFAFGHMPAFKANHTDCLDDYPTQRDTFWTSLKNAGARAYFCGHDHFYDHLRADDGDGNTSNDVHQLIVGSGGAPFYTSYTYDGANTTWAPVGVYHEVQYGYTLVEVDGLTVTMTFYHRTGPNTYAATSDLWSYTVIPPPNQPPSFVKGADQAVAQSAAPETQTVPAWATAISPGPPVESGQLVDFIVTNDRNYLFTVQPAMDATGTLSFTPARNLRGTALVTVRAHDNGGTANGGQDTSAPQTFQITIGLATDADGDDLPDDWEAVYGLTGHGPGVATADSDGDGVSNRDEYLAGTDPTNADDALRIIALNEVEGGESITLQTVPGKTYRVERNDDFPAGTWVQVGTDLVGTGNSAQVLDVAAGGLRTAVYRVRVLQP